MPEDGDIKALSKSNVIFADDLVKPKSIKISLSPDDNQNNNTRQSRVSPSVPQATPAEEAQALTLAEQAFESLPQEQQALLQRVAKQQKQAIYERNREIIEKFLAGKGILPAPNGKPSKLNLDQWLTVRTPLLQTNLYTTVSRSSSMAAFMSISAILGSAF